MRQIVLDTETTGLDPFSGHRIVEIGCLEIVNYVPTGQHYHVYLNPERSMPIEAFNVHGLGDDFLKDKPLFKDVADDFLAFIDHSPLVIHNARFDMKFLNAELDWIERQLLGFDRVIDTLPMAKKKYPGSPASLDALCKRFMIDNSNRIKHGALLDAELLAEVYLELMGGRQTTLHVPVAGLKDAQSLAEQSPHKAKEVRLSRPHPSYDAERAAHDAFLKKLKEPLWLKP